MMSKLLEREAVVRFDGALLAVRNPDVRAELIREIVLAVNDLNEGRADILLLAARRMACLYALLTLHGLEVNDPEKVVSDRFIELLPDRFWGDKSVILLDDTKVTKRTIAAREAAARRLVNNPHQVDARVALDLGDGAGRVRRSDALDLHNQFAMAFGTNLLPFFTDFAISKAIDVSPSQLDELLSSKSWKTIDVTNSVLAGSGARTFSLFPSGDFAKALHTALGRAAEIVEIAKIRLFVDDTTTSLRLRVVPIVLTQSLDEDRLLAWLRTMNIARTTSATQAEHAAGLIAMMLSRALFRVFADHVRTEFQIAVTEDEELAHLALGKNLSEVATPDKLEGFVSKDVVANHGFPEESEFSWPGHKRPSSSRYVLVGDDAVRDGFDLLVSLDKKSRATTVLSEVARKSKANAAASSVALDVLNDLGYSVPTFQLKDGQVVRAYRQGEAQVEYRDLAAGRLGGRLASIEKTVEFDDQSAGDPDGLG
jgi:hypothetical protein